MVDCLMLNRVGADTMLGMSQKKPKRASGKHAAPRRAVQFPAAWIEAAEREASTRPTPVMWYIVELIKRDLEAKGRKLPPPPWPEPPEE